jgi:hypothetical protein
MLLHYLRGRIEVEAFFPLSLCRQGGVDPQALHAKLSAALTKDPCFRHVRVYFG